MDYDSFSLLLYDTTEDRMPNGMDAVNLAMQAAAGAERYGDDTGKKTNRHNFG